MRKIRFKWLFVVLIMAIMLVGAVIFALSWWQKEADKKVPLVPTMPEAAIDEPALQLPSLPLTPQTMTDAQREAAIEMAGADASKAALASGQSEEQALQAAERARVQARHVFYPASSQP